MDRFIDAALAILRGGGPEMFFRFLGAGGPAQGSMTAPPTMVDEVLRANPGPRQAAAPYTIPQQYETAFPGIYKPLEDFKARVEEAYNLGIAPPSSPAPQDMMDYRKRAGPHLEQQMLDKQKRLEGDENWSQSI